MNQDTPTSFLLEQTDGPNYLVNGQKIGEASNRNESGCLSLIYKLYKSDEGKYVAQKIEGQYGPNEVSSYVEVKDDLKGVINFFGYNALAKELYDQADIAHVKTVN